LEGTESVDRVGTDTKLSVPLRAVAKPSKGMHREGGERDVPRCSPQGGKWRSKRRQCRAATTGQRFLPDRAPAPPPREGSRSGGIEAKGMGSGGGQRGDPAQQPPSTVPSPSARPRTAVNIIGKRLPPPGPMPPARPSRATALASVVPHMVATRGTSPAATQALVRPGGG
jgi:hypothetical protein